MKRKLNVYFWNQLGSKRKKWLAYVIATVVLLFLITTCVKKPNQDEPRGQVATALTVDLVSVKKQKWPETISATGALIPWHEAIISSEVGSYKVARINADVGAKVKKGDLLVTLSSEALEADSRKFKAALAQSVASLKLAEADALRARAVADSGALSPQKIEEYQVNAQLKRAASEVAQADFDNAKIKLAQTRITAIDDGVISSRSIVLGQVVNTGVELFRLVRGGRIEWRAELDVQQIGRVISGQSVTVSLPNGQKNEAAVGKVRLVAPTLNGSTGRGYVYVSLPSDTVAKSGSYATGVIEVSQSEASTLPETALVARDGRYYVLVIDAENKVHRQLVSVGRRIKGEVEILDGVSTETKIVLSGGGFLSDGAHVKINTLSK